MKAIRTILCLIGALKRALVVLVLFLSLLFNVAMFASATLYSAVSTTLSSITGAKSLVARQADDIVRLNADLDDERQARRQVEGELTESRAAQRQIRSELTDSRAVQRQVRDATTETTQRIGQRNTRAALRSVATMPAEAIPFFGTAIIVGAASLEIYDLCQTMIDMTKLQNAFTPEADIEPSDSQTTVCSIKVPTTQEVWASAKTAPQTAWTSAQLAMPSMQDIQNIDLPSFNLDGIADVIALTAADWAKTAGTTASGAASSASDALGRTSDYLWSFIEDEDEE